MSWVEAVQADKLAGFAPIDNTEIARWVFKRKALPLWRSDRPTDRANWVTMPKLAEGLGVTQQVAYWRTQNDDIHSHKLRPVRW